jgi:Ca-activated chloride channel family protein
VLEALTPDGGTRLTALDLAQYPGEALLLFTDGLSQAETEVLPAGKAPLTIISSAQGTDHGRLRRLAQQQGGRYLPLTQLSVPEALEALRFQPYRFLGATFDSTQVYDTWPRQPRVVGETFALAGKVRGGPAELFLHFGYGSTIIRTETIRLDPAAAQSGGGLLPHLWARKKLEGLLVVPDAYRQEILALGQRYGIVTPRTSLIVLDRVEDYVEYAIEPPAELKAAYDELLAQKQEKRRIEWQTHLDQVAEDYFVRRSWWETRFEVPDKPFQTDTAQVEREETTDWDSDGVPDVADVPTDEPALMEVLVVEEDAPSPEAPAPPPPGDAPAELSAEIVLTPWNPQTPYLDSLRSLSAGERYRAYLLLGRRYGDMPAYFLDVADLFIADGDTATALRVLSNLAELEVDNHELLRTLARRLGQWARWDLAAPLFRQLCELRPEEPQAFRNLGLALARQGQWQVAVDTLWAAIQRPWPGRFPGIGSLMVNDLNGLIAQSPESLQVGDIDTRLLRPLPVDLRVLLEWDANDVDMDLWVTDPRGEKCYYQHQRTAIGGWMSSDFTGGYGPEEFWLREAMPGRYRIQVNYYGSNRASLTGSVFVQARLITDFGMATQREQSITLRLSGEQEVLDIGEYVVE